MRKEDEPLETPDSAEGQGEKLRAGKSGKVVETDEELEEGALLGESTLAKLSATRKPEDSIAEKPQDAGSPPAPDIAVTTGSPAVGEPAHAQTDQGAEPAKS